MAKYAVGDRVKVLPNDDCTDQHLAGFYATVIDDKKNWSGTVKILIDDVSNSPYPPMITFMVRENILTPAILVPSFKSPEECEQWLNMQ